MGGGVRGGREAQKFWGFMLALLKVVPPTWLVLSFQSFKYRSSRSP